MRKITADYIFPINTAPIKNGVVHIDDNGNILEINSSRKGDEEVYEGIICPGFVNVHCHTELSFAKDKIEQGRGIDSFISDLEKLKSSISNQQKEKAVIEAMNQMQKNGIVAVGDIMNTDLSLKAKQNTDIEFYNFIEVFGSQSKFAESIWKHAIALYDNTTNLKNIIPHAPYSLSNELFQKIHDFQNENSIMSIHHLESEGELSFFKNGTGTIADRFIKWGLQMPTHIPTNKRPLESIAQYFINSNKLLLIHNTFIKKEDIDFASLNFSEIYYGLCPNANLYIEGKLPPIEILRNNNLNICLGTDSLASNNSLSIIEEIRTLKDNFDIPLQELIQWATLNGAKALGFDSMLGSIEPGKKPGLNLINSDFDIKVI